MNLVLQRGHSYPDDLLGQMYIGTIFECHTLEPLPRLTQFGAIPAGTYRVTFENSPKFGPDTLTISDVPGRTEIRIHSGNTYLDTHGCVIVGQQVLGETLMNSGRALAELKTRVRAALQDGETCSITIRDPL